MSSERTPEEKGRNLELYAEAVELEKEAKKLGTMTKAEVEASIADSGHDREKARELGRRAAEAFAKAEAREKAKVVPLRTRPSHLSARVAAAAALLVPVGYLAASEIGELALVGSSPDAGAENMEAAALRSEAADALEAGQWARCLELLDAAKRKDPKGDDAPGVRDVRRIAMKKLGRGEGSVP